MRERVTIKGRDLDIANYVVADGLGARIASTISAGGAMMFGLSTFERKVLACALLDYVRKLEAALNV